jgi:Tol biopolymer transport system component
MRTSSIVAVLLLAGRLFGAEPLAVVTFDGAAHVSHGKTHVAPLQIGSSVKVGTGYMNLDGTSNAFLDLGNGPGDELRLLGRKTGESVQAMTIWARVSSRQTAGGTRVLVGRWGPKRSFQLGVNSDRGNLDGRVTAAFTATGDFTSYVEAQTKDSGLVKHDGSQTVDLAVRFDRGNVTLFVDGTPQELTVMAKGKCQSIYRDDPASKTVIGGIVEPGQKAAADGRSFEGLINAVRIYGQALSDQEIAKLGEGREADAKRNRKIPKLVNPADVPAYRNPELVHVAVEESSQSGKYLSICPDICELKDGRLLCAYHRVGFVDWDGGYSTWTRTSDDGGLTWSEPKRFAEKIQAPALIRLKSGDVLLGGVRHHGGQSSTMLLYRSKDDGKTWTPQKPIWEKSTTEFILQGGNGSFTQLRSGRILCPVFSGSGGGTHPKGMKAWCFYSDDEGKTWQASKGRTTALPGVGSEEPAVAELSDGTLIMMLRSSVGAMYLSRSEDHGDTWSKPWSSGLEAPACPGNMVTLPNSDRLLMVYTAGQFDPQHHHKGERTPIAAAISDDAGKTWRKLADLVGGPHEFACVSICITSKGKVLFGMDWHRVPWNRDLKTGGVLVSIADLKWINRLAEKHKDVPPFLIGYTEGRNDLEGGQFVNWVTNRACVVGADGKGRKVLAEELTKKEYSWTQFAGWSPDGKTAIIGSHWESPKNAAWEREHKTFRMTEGWLSDSCLLDLATGKITNVTAVDRVSNYNGAGFTPDGKKLLMTSLIKGVSKPFLMDLDGRNKRDVSGGGTGFTYGLNASPDGKRISYHENYQIYISNADGSEKRKVETKNPFNFVPQWSPDGQWLLFVSGEHYNCHPHIVKKDGSGLKKLADRGGYRGVVQVLKHPDFHSASSDLPVWSRDGKSVYYTAKVGTSIELMRVDLDGNVRQLTKSKPGTRHYHPAVAPDGKWILFGSDRSGVMQLYVATADGKESWPVTNVPAGSSAMHGHWQPVGGTKPGGPEKAIPQEQPSDITPRGVENTGVRGVGFRSGDLLVGRSMESASAGAEHSAPSPLPQNKQ